MDVRLQKWFKGGRYTLALWLAASLAGCDVPRDREDAMAAAARIHTQIQSGQYSMIYRESAPAFQTSGNESQFISQMMNINAENGSFKDAVLIAYQTGVDSQGGRTHSLVFSVHYEQGKIREHLLFTRSSNSQMQLLKISMEPID